jgi:hypothetical protein
MIKALDFKDEIHFKNKIKLSLTKIGESKAIEAAAHPGVTCGITTVVEEAIA